ncbi:MAG: aminodeoxychorismate/anthranilate synthase component II, partial [Anaerotignum sp.]|nr:aminodeoxychorismate/anthranilate synthase component II [Anaerotignum sp.]
VHAKKLMHGKQSEIDIDNSSEIFQGLPQKIKAARYHSLVAERNSMPHSLEILGEVDGEVMAVRVKGKQIYGLQFHPESILSENGARIIKNFLEG